MNGNGNVELFLYSLLEQGFCHRLPQNSRKYIIRTLLAHQKTFLLLTIMFLLPQFAVAAPQQACIIKDPKGNDVVQKF